MHLHDIFRDISAVSSADIYKFMCGLSAERGDITMRRVGTSSCSRGIYALEMGSMRSPALFVGGTHGSEWASVFVSLALASDFADAMRTRSCLFGADIRRAFAQSGVVILPLLNPDGFELFRYGAFGAPRARRFLRRFEYGDFRVWQANARGVDINHNFNAGFYKARAATIQSGVTRPGPTRYGGPFHFSEQESRAVRRLCGRVRPRSVYALHSQGEEIYWRYDEREPKRAAAIASNLAALTAYRLCEPGSVASHGGLKDWFIKKYALPGFTIELGLGRNPLPYADFPEIWRRVQRALVVASLM